MDPDVHALAAEECDGVDNDCDGFTDEELGTTSCGKGVCLHTVAKCLGGVLQVCDPFEGVGVEECDGLDNDCNGLADEALGFSSCGLGLCAHTVNNCVGGIPQECDPWEGSAAEQCDGLDNDCDGPVDEELGETSCGLGQCSHSVANCVGGVAQVCDPLAGAAVETCDGVDNDCDDEVDEELGLVTCGLGECLHEQPYCEGGKVAICQPFLGAAQEVCDGVDNDCDGLVDEDQWPLTCGLGECVHTVPGCAGGVPQVCDPMAGAVAEECDGKDNDCDGLVDETLGTTTCGLGVCEHTVNNCIDGILQVCDPMKGSDLEKCDGLDNSCDGVVDPEGAENCVTYYNDFDADGWGVTGLNKCLCDPSAPFSALVDGDCVDTDENINPGAEEVCLQEGDENCDGEEDENCVWGSCAEALAQMPDLPSGYYFLDVDGDGPEDPFEVHCDMETDGGGWTLIMTTSASSAYLYSNSVWTDTSGGSASAPNPAAEEDYVSKGFYLLAGTESRLALGSTQNWNSWYHAQDTARNLSNQPRMAGSYGAAGNCAPKTNCGTEPVNKIPLGVEAGCSDSTSTKWHRFGYINDVNGWGTRTRVGFSGDNDGSDSSDSVMGLGLECFNACVPNATTGGPHNQGSGFYLYMSWSATPHDGPLSGWLWIR